MNSIKAVIYASFLACVIGVGRGNFCDLGPPGKYCLEDLTGWYNCQQQGDKMVQTETNCSQGKRCTCFFGPPCPSSVQDPCGNQELPPQFPPVFTAYYEEEKVACTIWSGCVTTHTKGVIYQNFAAKKLRHQRTTGNVTEYWITLPESTDGTFTIFAIREDTSTCIRMNNQKFPRFEVPEFCANEGSVFISGVKYEHWLWRSGGHNGGDTRIEENWYLWQDSQGNFQPGLYNSSYGRPDTWGRIDRGFPSFTMSVDDSEFDLPSICYYNR